MLLLDDYKENTFEEFFADALAQLPLLTKEWTNFNASDPGITMLENLTAFQVLQQSYIYQNTDKQKEALLALSGIRSSKGRPAKVYLSAKAADGQEYFPLYQKLYVGDMCFENNHPVKVKNHKITDIFLKHGKNIEEKNELISRELPVSSYVWGENPEAGMSLYIVVDSLEDIGDEIIFYVNVENEFPRNDFEFPGENPFAKIKWQLYTKEGYQELKAVDESECFLKSGAVKLKIPKGRAEKYHYYNYDGYVIRAKLEKSNYDVPPKVSDITGFLFEAWQKESKAITFTYPGKSSLEVHCDLFEQDYIQVFGREEDGCYYAYREHDGGGEGRYYRKIRLGQGKYRFVFSKEIYGYAPENEPGAIKIVAYDYDIMRQYHLGTLLGYDNQIIELPVKNIIPEGFCIIAKRENEAGENIYDFFKAGETEEAAIKYSLNEDEGFICITDAGEYINAELYIGRLATTRGENGNIDAGRPFTVNDKNVSVTNVSKGMGGKKRETIEELCRLFSEKASEQGVAVTAEDYENLARKTPGLCINKVRAIVDDKENQVKLVVIPAGKQEKPVLTKIYRDMIARHMENYRLLSTDIRIIGAVFVPVDIIIDVTVQAYYKDCERQIYDEIYKMADYINSGNKIGQKLCYEDIYNRVRNIDGVIGIKSLHLHSRNEELVKKQELDLVPAENCVLYPENITVQTGIAYR